MAISDNHKYLLNNLMGPVAKLVGLGDLIEDAEEGGLANDSVSQEHLDDGILPSHVVKYAGTHTTAGGDASETISVPGVLASDIVMVMIKTEGGSPVTCDRATAAADEINVTMSGDPSNDHVLQYVVYRAVS